MEPPIEIDCHGTLAAMAAEAKCVLLNCREPDEHETAHIQGAVLMPMSEFAQRATELTTFRERRIIVYCHHGGRSLRVAKWLRQHGFPDAQSMAGGIDRWSQEIDPSVPRY